MAAADAGTTTGTEPETKPEAEVDLGGPLVWDESVGPAPLVAGFDTEPVLLEWFGDGKLDLLVSAAGGPNKRLARLYRPVRLEPGGLIVFDEGETLEPLDGLRLFCPIPNDRETRFDLVALAPEGPVLLRNQGQANRPAFSDRDELGLPHDLGLGPGQVAQMVPVDWDGDGLIDLLVGFDDLEGYWPDGDAVPPAQQVGFNRRGAHPGYDRSGTWRGRPPIGKVVWLKNVGTVGTPRFESQGVVETESGPLDLAHRPAPLLLSWGASRASELLLTDAQGEIRLFRNFGGQFPPVLLEPRRLRTQGQPLRLPADRTTLVVADPDQDRRNELVFGTSDGRIFAVDSGTSRDEGVLVGPFLQEGDHVRLGGGAVFTTADLDSDGGLDIVYGDAPGRLYWVKDLGGPGDHRYALPELLEAGGDPFRLDPGPEGQLLGPIRPPLGFACPTLVDWKANGRPDLLLSGASGEVMFLRNNGVPAQPRFDFAEPIRCEGKPLILPPRVRPAAIDWEGSGELDLIALDLQGFLCVYPRVDVLDVEAPRPLIDRLGHLIRLDGSFGRGGLCCLWAGPWTGSERPDLLVGVPKASRFVVSALLGEPLTDLNDVPNILLLENLGKGVLLPRPIRHVDGRPLIVGAETCSPCGVDWRGDGTLDLLVGTDDGQVVRFPREQLKW